MTCTASAGAWTRRRRPPWSTRRRDTYEVSYYDLDPSPGQLRARLGAGCRGRASTSGYLRVDEPFGRSGWPTSTSGCCKEGGTPYEHALAIQDYLRTSGGFTYSLALEPRQGLLRADRPTWTRSATSW